MVQTPNYKLEEVTPGQAGREYVINLNSRRIDAYLAGVITRSLSTPPGSPTEGAYYIVGASPTGAWSGKANNLAIYVNGAWDFIAPTTGTKVWIIDELSDYRYNGTAWEANVLGNVPGGGTTDQVLTKNSNTSGDYSWKDSSGHTIQDEGVSVTNRSILNFTGSGVVVTDDNVNLKTVITISTGGRESLSANRTYYVRSDGNDSNNGLTNTSGGAFATWQKAKETLWQLDGKGYIATVQGTGTFTENILFDGQFIGFSKIVLKGDTTTPANCTLSPSSGDNCLKLDCSSTPFDIEGIRFNAPSVANGLFVADGKHYLSGVCDFGTIGTHQIYLSGGKLHQRSDYTISGNAAVHLAIYDDAFFDANGSSPYTVTMGSRSYVSGFVLFGRHGKGLWVNITYSGSVSGFKYTGSSPTFLQLVGTTLPGSGTSLTQGAVVF